MQYVRVWAAGCALISSHPPGHHGLSSESFRCGSQQLLKNWPSLCASHVPMSLSCHEWSRISHFGGDKLKQFPPYRKPNKPRDPADLRTSEKTLSPTVTPPASDLDPSIPRHTCKFSHWTTERADEISRLTAEDYMHGLWTLVLHGMRRWFEMGKSGKSNSCLILADSTRAARCTALSTCVAQWTAGSCKWWIHMDAPCHLRLRETSKRSNAFCAIWYVWCYLYVLAMSLRTNDTVHAGRNDMERPMPIIPYLESRLCRCSHLRHAQPMCSWKFQTQRCHHLLPCK